MQLSIILPVLNEVKALASTLGPLQAWRGSGRAGFSFEIIVVDGGSADETVSVAHGLADQVLCSGPGRARQMNVGAAVAGGAYVLFLHADTLLPEALPRLCHHWHRDKVGWGYFSVRLSGRRWPLRVIETCINWRSWLTGVSTGDQCQFVRRELYRRVGGIPELPLMEDVAFSKRLRQQDWPRMEQQRVVTSSRRWETGGIVKTVLLMWFLRLAFFCGVSPRRLAALYYPGRNVVSSAARGDGV